MRSTEPRPSSCPDARDRFINRELSWLSFARRVLSQVGRDDLPVLERVKFAGIVGMLHDEFFMKRVNGLKRQVRNGVAKLSIDGRSPEEELAACRKELLSQGRVLDGVIAREVLPALAEAGCPILAPDELDAKQREFARAYCEASVRPILTPLAVDAEHPFPFIRHGGLNLAVVLPADDEAGERFVRIKVPDNRPRWLALPGGGFVSLEQVIATNLDLLFRETAMREIHSFRVTRGATGEPRRPETLIDEETFREPGSIVRLVSDEIKARRFAGVVRLQTSRDMPRKRRLWLAGQLEAEPEDVYPAESLLATSDLLKLEVPGRPDLHHEPHVPATHPRLRALGRKPRSIFREISRGDVLLHHPYHDFDDSVLRFLQSAAEDPQVVAIKLTIYRAGSESPIIRALAEAARRGKQVAVLVEITARFDEASNIAWGRYLENEGVHVAYGVEHLKTHVKLALVIREEKGGIRHYAHVGTGNYNARTARVYEDLGLLTSDPDICADVASVFNSLTGALPEAPYRQLIVAPRFMRDRFVELIRREAEHARQSRPRGIQAKMNQLQDPAIIQELQAASQAGVPIQLNVRGLCCLRPGVTGVSDRIHVFGVVGRFLEHSRIYRFTNGGDVEYFIGSADWMKRSLDRRMETVVPVRDARARAELDHVLEVHANDNCSAWDCQSDGAYVRRTPAAGESRRAAQEAFAGEAARHLSDLGWRGAQERGRGGHAAEDELQVTADDDVATGTHGARPEQLTFKHDVPDIS